MEEKEGWWGRKGGKEGRIVGKKAYGEGRVVKKKAMFRKEVKLEQSWCRKAWDDRKLGLSCM